ncbi:MAG: single-stranded DNA-binding protein, partial [Pisciglobus halotolerans]|nr:single-stranded DNA-binding protein [Pisciglobus halotolerans]
IGRLTRKPCLRELGEGKQVLTNTLAVPKSHRKEKGPEADFIPIVAWGKTAELIDHYCKKGDQIGLSGKMQSRTYTNKEDETVYIVEMNVESIDFLQNKQRENLVVAASVKNDE